jgi:hypothetical protein
MIATRLLQALGLLAFASFTLAIHAQQPASDAVALRIDGVYEITKGNLANPFEIGLGPDGKIMAGKPVYVKADFKPFLADKKPIKNADRRKVREVIEADRLILDVQFPHADPDQKPIAVQGWLRPDFCCGKGLDGTFPIPEQARRGDVTLRIAWPASGSLRAGSTTIDVAIGPAKDAPP